MSGANDFTTEGAERYAAALFELARDAKAIDAVAADLDAFSAMVADSVDLKRLIESPAFGRDDKERALSAIVDKAGFNDLAKRFVAVSARNGRAAALPAIAKAFRARFDAHRGVTVADVRSAAPMTEAQMKKLSAALKKALGRDVEVRAEVEPELLGGLVVKVGSRMFDSSLRTRLEGLKTAMKGA